MALESGHAHQSRPAERTPGGKRPVRKRSRGANSGGSPAPARDPLRPQPSEQRRPLAEPRPHAQAELVEDAPGAARKRGKARPRVAERKQVAPSRSPVSEVLGEQPPELYEALKADIDRRGPIVPVVVDTETGEVVDGDHRVRACRELGLPPPPAVRRSYGSGAEREAEALRLNLLRRQVGPISWARGYERLCELEGVRLGRGGDRKSTATVAIDRADQLALQLGVKPRTARWRVQLARRLEPHPDLVDQVDRQELSAKDARAQARIRELAQKRELAAALGANATLPARVEIRVGDFAAELAKLDDRSVDMIFTDPPYLLANDLEWIYGELARQAARVLKPGASLIAYTGGHALPRALPALDQYLTYWWPIAIVHAGGRHNTLAGKKVRVKWKPALWFVNGHHAGDRIVDDLVGRSAPDKTLHDWAQSPEEARSYIEHVTPKGGLVVDPFCGSGTTLLAAHQSGRQALGIERDRHVANRARHRLAQEIGHAG